MAKRLRGINSLEEIQDFEDGQEEAATMLGAGEIQLAELEQQVRRAVIGDLRATDTYAGADTEEEEEPYMTEGELKSLINNELSNSLGSSDELSGNLSTAMDYYLGRKRGDEIVGRSQIQSLDVADMIEALMAQIMPSFTRNMSVEFGAMSPADEMSASRESEYISYVIQEENNGYTTFYKLFKDALLLKNCICEITVETKDNVDIEQYNDLDPLAIGQILQPKHAADEEITTSQPTPSETAPGRFNIEVTRKWKGKVLVIDPKPVDEFRVNSDHRDISLQDARFMGYFEIVSESDLIEAGYDEEDVKALPTFGHSTGETQQARSQLQSETNHYGEKCNRPISIFKGLFKVDFDGDGVAERRRIVAATDQYNITHILENEVQAYCNIASGTPFIQNDRWLGLSIFDKLKEIQDQKTGFLRNTMDNAYFANNKRLGYVVGKANADDVHNSKPGSSIRLKRPDAIVPIEHTNILPHALQMLGYLDKIRSERAGAALDMQSEALPVGAETAHGAERLVSAKEQLASMIANTLAETVIRDMYLITHKMVSMFMGGAKQFKKGNDWHSIDPTQWPERERVAVSVGMSQGERIQQAGAIQQTLQSQKEAMQTGFSGVLVSAQNVYHAQLDYARLAGIVNPEKYWIDPASQQAQQAAQNMQKQNQQMQKQQEQQQQQMMQLQLELQKMQEETKRMKNMLDARSDAAELNENREQHLDNTAIDLTELELTHDTDVPGAVV